MVSRDGASRFALPSFKVNYMNNFELVEILNVGVFIWKPGFLLCDLV